MIGPAIRFAKRLVRRSLRWYVAPIMEQQTRFNHSLLDMLERLRLENEKLRSERVPDPRGPGRRVSEPEASPEPEPSRPPVAVVILTWNALAFTQRCLAALQERTDHPAWRLIVVDNGSTDGTVEWLRQQDWLTLFENATNLGFTKGCNIGIAASTPDEDVVLMNNDVDVVDTAWLTKLQDTAYADETTGVVGSRLVHQDGTVLHLGAYMQPVTIMGQQVGGYEIDVNQ